MNTLLSRVRQIARSRGFDLVRHKPLPDLLHLHDVEVVLDIGANDGGYASQLRDAGWNGPIISFEPQPHAFARLEKRFHEDHNWTGHRMGLGSQSGELEMNIHGMDVLSSFLTKRDHASPVERVAVEVKRLDEFLPSIVKAESKVFIKIDTQGFEKEIIKGCGAITCDVIGWQMEMSVQPLYEGQMVIEESISLMRDLGFSLWQILPGLRDPATHQGFEFDGIFFKDSLGSAP